MISSESQLEKNDPERYKKQDCTQLNPETIHLEWCGYYLAVNLN